MTSAPRRAATLHDILINDSSDKLLENREATNAMAAEIDGLDDKLKEVDGRENELIRIVRARARHGASLARTPAPPARDPRMWSDFARVQVAELSGTVQTLEKEVRDLGMQSAIGPDGKVNVAHTRKKRRLDGEFEAALEVLQVRT